MNIIKKILKASSCDCCNRDDRDSTKPKITLTPKASIQEGESDRKCNFDQGNRATVIDVDDKAYLNDYFRRSLWTGEYMQLVLMSVPIGSEIELERHLNTDQLLFVKKGIAEVYFGKNSDTMKMHGTASFGDVITIPSGMVHRIKNVGRCPLKLYSVYAPPHHPFETAERSSE